MHTITIGLDLAKQFAVDLVVSECLRSLNSSRPTRDHRYAVVDDSITGHEWMSLTPELRGPQSERLWSRLNE